MVANNNALKTGSPLRVGIFPSAPTGEPGLIYYDSSLNALQQYTNGAWDYIVTKSYVDTQVGSVSGAVSALQTALANIPASNTDTTAGAGLIGYYGTGTNYLGSDANVQTALTALDSALYSYKTALVSYPASPTDTTLGAGLVGAYADGTGTVSAGNITTEAFLVEIDANLQGLETQVVAAINTIETTLLSLTLQSSLTDVTITTPSNGQILEYNGTAWVNASAGSSLGIGNSIAGAATGGLGSILFSSTTGTLAEDASNLVWDDTNYLLGIGTSAPAAALHVLSSSTSVPRGILSDEIITGTQGAQINARKARGTVGSLASVNALDNLGSFGFLGYNGTAYSSAQTARMAANATEAWSSTAQGTSLQFSVTPNGTTNTILGMIIDNNGNVGIGTSTTPAALLSVGSGSPFVVDGSGDVTANNLALNGELTVTNGEMSLNSVGYIFPTTQATTAGQLLTNDATGVLSWAFASLGTLSDVMTSMLSDGQLLQYVGADGKWENVSPVAVTGAAVGTPANVGQVIITNTSGFLDQSFLNYNINFNSNVLSNIASPVVVNDVANKGYVDLSINLIHLTDLKDVGVVNANAGDIVCYDATTQIWENVNSTTVYEAPTVSPAASVSDGIGANVQITSSSLLIAEPFTPNANINLTAIGIKILELTVLGTLPYVDIEVNLSVYSDNAGVPGTNLVTCSSTIDSGNFTYSDSVLSTAFSQIVTSVFNFSPYALSSGTPYWLVLSVYSGDPSSASVQVYQTTNAGSYTTLTSTDGVTWVNGSVGGGFGTDAPLWYYVNALPSNGSNGAIIRGNSSGFLDESLLQYHINLGGNLLSGLSDPLLAQDAATRNYVDNAISGIATSLGNLSDVNVTLNSGPNNGDVLTYNSTDTKWENVQPNLALAGLTTDVSFSGLADGQTLTYIGGAWHNSPYLIGADIVLYDATLTYTSNVSTTYTHSTTLSGSSSGTGFSFGVSAHSAQSSYQITDAAGDVRTGILFIATDGATTVSVTDTFAETADCGITWDGSITSGTVTVTYTNAQATDSLMRSTLTVFPA